MSRRPGSPTLAERVDALDRAVALASGHLDDADVSAVRGVLGKVRDRMGHGTEFTVVALAGPTGAGKSSLFNVIAGDGLSDVGVRRPTTGVAHAAIWSDDDHGAEVGELLDWLGVGRRHHVAVAPRHPLVGLIMIDLPDFDSTRRSNRAEVDRMLQLVDLVVWVTDPQKYADEAFHDGYVRPIAGHREVLRFVLNKVDTIAESDLGTVVRDLRRRLLDDGIDAPEIVTSAVPTRVGFDDVDTMLRAAVEARRSMNDRLEADLRTAATLMLSRVGDSPGLDAVPDGARRRFVERLAIAAGADTAGAMVAAQHRFDARRAIGWLPARLFARWRRPHPIADLPRATVGSVAGSEVSAALRDLAEAAAGDAPPPWPNVLRSCAEDHDDTLRRDLTSSTRSTAIEAVGAPRWWTVASVVQRSSAAVAAVGALWLVAASAAGGFLNLDTDPLLIETPGADWIPLPSLLVLGGLGLGAVLALVAGVPVRISANRRAGRVRSELVDRVAELADDGVLADLERVLDERRRLGAWLRTAARQD